MKKIILFLKFIATGSFALMLTACYGIMYGVYEVIDGKVTVTNTAGEPIPGLKLSIIEDDTTVRAEDLTDSFGKVDFSIDMNTWFEYRLDIEDIDGEENLGYHMSKSILLEPDYEAGNLNIETPIEVVETSPDLNAE